MNQTIDQVIKAIEKHSNGFIQAPPVLEFGGGVLSRVRLHRQIILKGIVAPSNEIGDTVDYITRTDTNTLKNYNTIPLQFRYEDIDQMKDIINEIGENYGIDLDIDQVLHNQPKPNKNQDFAGCLIVYLVGLPIFSQ